MDFGAILDAWEKQQKSAVGKKTHVANDCASHQQTKRVAQGDAGNQQAQDGASCQQSSGCSKQLNPQELWLRKYGVVDKDKLAEEAHEHEKEHSVSYLKTLPIEARVDLHGLTRDEAWNKLVNFTGDCMHRGVRKVLIIHGKGIHTTGSDPVLGEVVRRFIESDKRCGASGHPNKRLGGNGATWVLLKYL
ncbi:MAG: Smr/MutS family protein [Treponema sp.]|nr:Smr/MutS family protein [Treponema sp.]